MPSNKNEVEVTTLVKRIAKLRNKSEDKAQKEYRAFVRGNFSEIATDVNWKALKASGKVNRDNSNYPKSMPAHVAECIATRDLKHLKATPKRRNKKSPSKATPKPITSDNAVA